MGPSDYGLPIYVCILNGAKDSTVPSKARKRPLFYLTMLFIREPDGINACLIWLEELLNNKKSIKKLPWLLLFQHTILVECSIDLVIVEPIKTDQRIWFSGKCSKFRSK